MAQPYPVAAPPAPSDPGKLPRLWPWITLLVAGAVLAFAGLVTFVVTGVVALVNIPVHYDATFSVPCSTGDYLIYLPADRTTRTTTSTATSTPRAFNATVTAPTGGSVATFVPSQTMSVTRGGTEYRAQLEFHATRSGTYEVHVSTAALGVLVGPTVKTAFTNARPWLGAFGAGALIGVVGLVLLIVFAVRRSKVKAERSPPPANWPYGGWPPGPAPGPYGPYAGPYGTPPPAPQWVPPGPPPAPGAPGGWPPPPQPPAPGIPQAQPSLQPPWSPPGVPPAAPGPGGTVARPGAPPSDPAGGPPAS